MDQNKSDLDSKVIVVKELSDIEKVARLNALMVQKPKRSLDMYVVGEVVEVEKLLKKNGPFGDCVLMETKQFSTWLPEKFNKMTSSDVSEYNDIPNLYMMYAGKINRSHSITFKIGEIMDFYNPETFNGDEAGYYVENN